MFDPAVVYWTRGQFCCTPYLVGAYREGPQAGRAKHCSASNLSLPSILARRLFLPSRKPGG
jgi:hypothetical protein